MLHLFEQAPKKPANSLPSILFNLCLTFKTIWI